MAAMAATALMAAAAVVVMAATAAMALPAPDPDSAGAEPGEHVTFYASAAEYEQHRDAIEGLRDRTASLQVKLLPEGPLPVLAAQAVSGGGVNLLQGEFSSRASLGSRLRAWRLPAALVAALMLGFGLLFCAAPALALIHAHPDETTATGVVRSLESLRDLDYQSWQVVAYREGPPRPDAVITLRIVGYPGRVRLDHPTPLLVTSGRRLWELADTTLKSPKLAGDGRAAAAEFNLSPLLQELGNNRPLRLELPGVFTELPVPPYVVAEWRSLPTWKEGDEQR